MTVSLSPGGASSPAETVDPAGNGGSGDVVPGVVTISDKVVATLAAQVAAEQPDAGAAASRVLGVAVPGSSLLGTRETDLTGRPKTSATVNGSIATVEVSMSVRWPASVRRVTEQVRSAIRDRVGAFTGLDITEVRIHVTDFAAAAPPPPRVR